MSGTREQYFEHVAEAGERWDLLAHRYYGDVRRQSVIIRANRHVFVEPDTGHVSVPPARFRGGEVLRIPVIEDGPDAGSAPPWKRDAPSPPPSAGRVRRIGS